MTAPVKLRDYCHARSGDKGDIANIGLIAYDPRNFEWLKAQVTAPVVADYFKQLATGPVECFELPKIAALNFVIRGALGGGVSRSLMLDGHGKGYSSFLLEMEVVAPPSLSAAGRPSQAGQRAKDRGSQRCIRLGSGSAAFSDRVDPAVELAETGAVDYLVFDSQSEKTYVEHAHHKLMQRVAYDILLERKLRAVLEPCARNGIKIITNGGIADVRGAASLIAAMCEKLGLPKTRIAYVLPDDLLDLIRELDPIAIETGRPVSAFGDALIGAQAYQGAGPMVEGLAQGADVVLTSRGGDSPQFLAPMIHEFGWPFDDWGRLGKGLGVGHLMECAGQLTGGFFADPDVKTVPDLDRIGFPIAEVYSNGDAVITKLPGTGGVVSEGTCKEQLLYELPDPRNYLHNDGVVDFTSTDVIQIGPDRVEITGTGGRPRPPTVKVNLGVLEDYVAVGRAMYGGSGAYERAQLAANVIEKRMVARGMNKSSLRFDFVGVNSLFPWKGIDTASLKEVELRISGHFPTEEAATEMLYEVELLSCNGPAALCQGRRLDYMAGPERVIGYYTALIPQDAVHFEVRVSTADEIRAPALLR